MSQEDVEEALDHDPLRHAEELTGESYKEDEFTEALGFLGHIQHNQKKRELLQEHNDTTFSMNREDYVDVVKDLGFEELFHDRFPQRSGGEDEHLQAFWEPQRGILLSFDTFGVDKINSAKFVYNWKPYDMDERFSVTSSGSFTDGVWVGHHDGREGLRTKIQRLEDHGDFVLPWIKPHSMATLYGYSESDQKQEKIIENYNKIPSDIIDQMGDLSNILYLDDDHNIQGV